ncbi:MAG: NUDIX hydrolase [Ignavibacteriae bacterium]|nr:NUDIX hydrolase [Ignavibacteriota bacterium]
MRNRGNWKVKSEKEVYSNPYFKIIEYDVVQPDGQDGFYGVIKKLDATYVIALTENNEIYLLKEFRFASEEILINLPAGRLEEELSYEINAKKELKEETGIIANNYEYLGNFIIDPGSQGTRTHVMLATGLDESNVTLENLEGNEDILEIMKLPIAEVKMMIAKNEIKCGATMASLNIFFTKFKL